MELLKERNFPTPDIEDGEITSDELIPDEILQSFPTPTRS